MELKNYYEILGVFPTASQAEIKKRYRELVIIYHPDKNQGDCAMEERFKEIGEAYSIIGNPDKREEYDFLSRELNLIQSANYINNFWNTIDKKRTDIMDRINSLFDNVVTDFTNPFDSIFNSSSNQKKKKDSPNDNHVHYDLT